MNQCRIVTSLTKIASVAVAALLLSPGTAVSQSAISNPTPPPEPQVKPIISAPVDRISDNSKVDDRIRAAVAGAKAVLADRQAATNAVASAQSVLDGQVEVELIFDKQITQPQIDAFLKAGGTVTHVMQNVSYGWTGTIARGKAVDLPASLGGSLLGIVEAVPMQFHLDEACQCGRVRPSVWDAGIDGNRTATANKITIGILDSGVDGSHTDLTGRQEYWEDDSGDGNATPVDYGHHGSHVAGIATGTGASLARGATLNYVTHGYFATAAGNFYPNLIHVPTSVGTINWTSTMRWDTGGGGTARIGQAIGSAGGYSLFGSGVTDSTASPVAHTDSDTNSAGVTYTPYATWNTAGSTAATSYSIENSVSYAAPAGDSYNTLRGVAPDCQWAGFKVFTNAGAGNSTMFNTAIDNMVTQRSAHQIKVANVSLGIVGSPGIDTSERNKVNTAVANGIVMVVAAGNSGGAGSGTAGQISDPGRAQYVITVAASSDSNQLTDYSSHGFTPGSSVTGDGDTKPDITAPGGSTLTTQSEILSIDSNWGDSNGTTGFQFTDGTANNYLNIHGTSMATPFISGCAALVIDAMQQSGETWSFASNASVLKVKMLLLMTATETNLTRELGPSANPTLDRGNKDQQEGYGIVNADAATEAVTQATVAGPPVSLSGSMAAEPYGKRCYARKVSLTSGKLVTLNMSGSGDFDLYLYKGTADQYGNPQILAKSTNGGTSTESISYTPSATETGYVVVKQVSGTGSWSINGFLPVGVSEYLVD